MDTRTTIASNARYAMLLSACALLSACGGGTQTPPDTPTGLQPPPAPAPPSPPVEGAQTYYFSDCQSGAAAGCLPGSDTNPGTSASAPRRTLASLDVNALPAGTQLLFARGGVWTVAMTRIENLNVTPASPLVFDAYGSGPRPVFNAPGATTAAIEFGNWQNTTNDGGYVLRNLKLDGQGSGMWGLWLRDNLRQLTLENLEITGFEIAIHSQSAAPHGVNQLTLRNSSIHRNSSMGILGQFNDSVIEGNSFENNNFSGSTFNHAIYLSGGAWGGRNNVVRSNSFINNSTVDGVCRGGNVTMHGQMDGMLIEGNSITQTASTRGCWGFSITSGYDTPEWFRNFVVRGNTIVNLGGCSICIDAAPGIVVERNTIVNTQTTYHAGVVTSTNGGPGDDPGAGAIVRDNVACYPTSAANQYAVDLRAPSPQASGNVAYTGGAALTGACAL